VFFPVGGHDAHHGALAREILHWRSSDPLGVAAVVGERPVLASS
jgi:hypothetical protein